MIALINVYNGAEQRNLLDSRTIEYNLSDITTSYEFNGLLRKYIHDFVNQSRYDYRVIDVRLQKGELERLEKQFARQLDIF